MREFVWFLICLSLISCKSRDQHKIHISQIETKISTDESGNEIFGSFYPFFVEDSIFQKHRTIIPESVTSPEYTDPEGNARDTVWSVDIEKWEYISIKSTNGAKNQDDTTFVMVNILTDKGLDLIESQFYRKQGKWYLDLTTNKNRDLLYRLIRSM